ncbi:hypothetical protein GF322_04950 [Candidatus Dependentiae bacterium]|nr:hypothetical protein [Candidatus Dependentiae bacterium]
MKKIIFFILLTTSDLLGMYKMMDIENQPETSTSHTITNYSEIKCNLINLPDDIWIEILTQLFLGQNFTSALKNINAISKTCKRLNKLLHNPEFLKRFFKHYIPWETIQTISEKNTTLFIQIPTSKQIIILINLINSLRKENKDFEFLSKYLKNFQNYMNPLLYKKDKIKLTNFFDEIKSKNISPELLILYEPIFKQLTDEEQEYITTKLNPSKMFKISRNAQSNSTLSKQIKKIYCVFIITGCCMLACPILTLISIVTSLKDDERTEIYPFVNNTNSTY